MSEPEPIARGSLPTGKPILPSRPATGTETVTVACKITNGLVLRVYEMELYFEASGIGTARETKKAVQVGEDVVIRGNALNITDLRGGRMPEYPHVGGFALTSGVSREFWEKWLEQNADQACVKNGLVFAQPTIDRASGEARDRKDIESGFEGIDPDNPSKRTGIRAVTKGDRKVD